MLLVHHTAQEIRRLSWVLHLQLHPLLAVERPKEEPVVAVAHSKPRPKRSQGLDVKVLGPGLLPEIVDNPQQPPLHVRGETAQVLRDLPRVNLDVRQGSVRHVALAALGLKFGTQVLNRPRLAAAEPHV